MHVNPALADLQPVAGKWRMELYNAAFLPEPETPISGLIAIDWIEDGSALRIRQGDSEHPPAAIWIIGRDEREAGYTTLYADDRGVSRIYHMSLENPSWRMWRETPEFSKRFDGQLEPSGEAIRGRWQKSTDQGRTWEHDFNIDYIRE